MNKRIDIEIRGAKGAGKTTVLRLVADALAQAGCDVMCLDGAGYNPKTNPAGHLSPRRVCVTTVEMTPTARPAEAEMDMESAMNLIMSKCAGNDERLLAVLHTLVVESRPDEGDLPHPFLYRVVRSFGRAIRSHEFAPGMATWVVTVERWGESFLSMLRAERGSEEWALQRGRAQAFRELLDDMWEAA